MLVPCRPPPCPRHPTARRCGSAKWFGRRVATKKPLAGMLGPTPGKGQSPTLEVSEWLLQFRVVRLGLLQDWDVGVGIFPECQEILIRAFCFGHIAVNRVGSSKLKMRERTQRKIQNDTAMIEEFLEFGSGRGAVVGHELGLAAQVHRVQSSLLRRWWRTQFVGSSGFPEIPEPGLRVTSPVVRIIDLWGRLRWTQFKVPLCRIRQVYNGRCFRGSKRKSQYDMG